MPVNPAAAVDPTSTTPHAEPQFSELMPFRNRARWQRLGRRGLLAPALVISAVVALLFYYTDKVNLATRVQYVCNASGNQVQLAYALGLNPNAINCSQLPYWREQARSAAERFNQIFGLMLLSLSVYFVYARAGRRVSMSTLAGVFVIVAFATWKWSDDVMAPLFFLIKNPLEWLFGGSGQPSGVIVGWVRMLLTTAFPEELYKVLPLFVALWATTNAKEPWRTRLRVTEPLDGILFAVAAAAGFIYAETYSLYVRNQITDLLQLQLAIPRVLGGIAGHIAYSTIAGYYVALGWTRSKNRWMVIILGLLLASAVHATWNTFAGMGGGMTGTLVSAIIKIGAFGAMLMVLQTAREYSPSRNSLGGSVLAPNAFSVETSTMESPVPAPFTTPAPSVAAASTTTARATLDASPAPTNGSMPRAARVRLISSTTSLDLSSGDTVSVAQWPGLIAAANDDVVAQLLTHPDDHTRIGLRNRSSESWSATTPADGRTVTVAPGSVVSLKNGMSIRSASGDMTVSLE